MKQIILLPQDIAESGKKYLLKRGYELKVGQGISEEEIIKDVKGCSAVIARLGVFGRKMMESEPGLRVIARHGVGYDNIDLICAEEKGIWVTNDPVSNQNAVAEHCISLLLSCSKNIPFMDKAVREGRFFLRNQIFTNELQGKVLGIVGFGRIGCMVAQKAEKGFGMKILVYDPYAQEIGEARRADTLKEVLEQSDFVSLHFPLSNKTKGMFGAREFAWMKPNAWFINGARGELVKEKDLIQALKSKTIAGAALDVFEKEPPELDNELFKFDNVVLSPHNAALTKETMERMSMIAAKAVDAVLSGERPEFVVIDGR